MRPVLLTVRSRQSLLPGSRDIDLCDFTAAQRTRRPQGNPSDAALETVEIRDETTRDQLFARSAHLSD